MHVLFGTADAGDKASTYDSMRAHLRAYGSVATHSEGPKVRLGHIGGPSKAIGTASSGGAVLVLLGGLHLPLPDWRDSQGSPLDDADKTARYLLERYRRHDVAFLDGVFGYYNVVVADGERLILATDPYDHRRLYLSDAEPLAFSTNLLTLARGFGERLHLDRSFEDFFLTFGFFPLLRTPYAGIRRMPGGTIVDWNEGQRRVHRIAQSDPWAGHHAGLDFSGATVQELSSALHTAFMRALEEQLASSRRAAVLLGGFDSALVASALKELGKEVETFSFYYEDARYNQPHTDTVARYLGIRHHWVTVDAAVMTDGLTRYAEVFNEPTCWPNYVIGTVRIAEEIVRAGFDYCYSGDGCDQVFFGYPLTYKRLKAVQAFDRVPPTAAARLVRAFARPTLERMLGRPYHVALGLMRGLELDETVRQFLSLRVLDSSSLSRLRRGPQPVQEMAQKTILDRLAQPHRGLHPVRLAYAGKGLVSPTKLKMNASTDKTGLLIFSPFLHAGMKHFVQRIPETLIRPEEEGKRVEVIGKYILVRMAEEHRMLPPEVIHQRKVGAVDAPVEQWYGGPLRPVLDELFKALPFEADDDYLRGLLRPKLAERGYAYLLARYTNNITSITLAPSLLATLAPFARVARQPA